MSGKTNEEKEFDVVCQEQFIALRKSLNLTKSQFSLEIGMSRQNYEKFEMELRTPSLFTLLKIFENLDANAGDFVNELFAKYKNERRQSQLAADQESAREYYRNARKKKAKSED